jgi:hypothetical protein
MKLSRLIITALSIGSLIHVPAGAFASGSGESAPDDPVAARGVGDSMTSVSKEPAESSRAAFAHIIPEQIEPEVTEEDIHALEANLQEAINNNGPLSAEAEAAQRRLNYMKWAYKNSSHNPS